MIDRELERKIKAMIKKDELKLLDDIIEVLRDGIDSYIMNINEMTEYGEGMVNGVKIAVQTIQEIKEKVEEREC